MAQEGAQTLVEPLVEVEIEGGIVWLKLNDPAARNALSEDMAVQLRQAFRDHSDTARVFILTGKGEGFCAGAKLGGKPPVPGSGPRDLGAPLLEHYNPLLLDIRNLSVPLIVAINGAAAGIGSSLALSGDIIVASEAAFFQQAFSRIALAPDGGATYLLAKSAGRVRTMELALLDQRMSAAQALDWGLINRVVAADDLIDVARELGQQIATGPTLAYAAIRRLVWQACEAGYEEHLNSEAREQTVLGKTADHKAGVQAFLSRQKPVFTGS
jgi:2-(1,2-epoxy-1,2-dihydrophenyl)acetyl-CoA isomerase